MAFLSRKCPCCGKPIPFSDRKRMLFLTMRTTIICSQCDNTLRLKTGVKLINLVFAFLIAGFFLSPFSLAGELVYKVLLGIGVFYPLITSFCYSYEESDYID